MSDFATLRCSGLKGRGGVLYFNIRICQGITLDTAGTKGFPQVLHSHNSPMVQSRIVSLLASGSVASNTILQVLCISLVLTLLHKEKVHIIAI